MFPAGQAPLIVCNPPWLPARPSSPIEHAIYDEGNHMLRGFLSGLAAHLSPRVVLAGVVRLGRAYGLRTREQLLAWIAEGSLRVIERHDVRRARQSHRGRRRAGGNARGWSPRCGAWRLRKR